MAVAAGCGGTSRQGNSKVIDPQATTSPEPPTPEAPLPLAGRTVLIDPGHNGGNASATSAISRLVPAGRRRMKACDTSGTATNDGRLTEARFNWLIARAVVASLRHDGARVVLTRSDNAGVGPCIDQRATIGNTARADFALSIHADGGPPTGSGFHVTYPAQSQELARPAIVDPSYRAARHLRAALRGAGLVPANYVGGDGRSERSDLGGLNLSDVPKAFVELGNMRNNDDAAALASPPWRRATAAALVNGIRQVLRPPAG